MSDITEDEAAKILADLCAELGMTPERMAELPPGAISGLRNLEAKASYYNLAHGVLTGKFDQNFTEWKSVQKIDEKTAKLPDLGDLRQWIFRTATVNDLFAFQSALNGLIHDVLVELFGKYSEQHGAERRTITHSVEDLSELRQTLTTTLTGSLNLSVQGITEFSVGDVMNLPSVKYDRDAFKPTDLKTVDWKFSNAPSVKTEDSEKTGGNYRSHNTTVKFVVDGVLVDVGNLGACVKHLFPTATSVQEIGKQFDDWDKAYFSQTADPPEKVWHRDERKIWLTLVGK